MSLPKITAYVGENEINDNKNQFTSIVKTLKDPKKSEERYITFLVLDLAKCKIYFQLNKNLVIIQYMNIITLVIIQLLLLNVI